jgi:hypothetical protein
MQTLKALSPCLWHGVGGHWHPAAPPGPTHALPSSIIAHAPRQSSRNAAPGQGEPACVARGPTGRHIFLLARMPRAACLVLEHAKDAPVQRRIGRARWICLRACALPLSQMSATASVPRCSNSLVLTAISRIVSLVCSRTRCSRSSSSRALMRISMLALTA